MDDGPSAREFLEDDYDDDNGGLPDDEPLTHRAQELQTVNPSGHHPLPEVPENDDEEPPSPPPKT